MPFLFLLLACTDIKTDGGNRETAVDSPILPASDSADSADSLPDSDSPVESESPPCEGVRLVQAVAYPVGGAGLYDLAPVPGGFAVSFPGGGEAGAGIIEIWHLDQGASLDREVDEPALTVSGDGSRQALGVQLWAPDDATLCSQTYGDDYAGHWYCWPSDQGGAVDDVATLSISGSTPGAYFGYGVGDMAFDAYVPGQVIDSTGANLWSGVCGDEFADCESAAVIGDTIAAIDSATGVVYAHSLTSGDLLWTADLGATSWGPSYIWAPHGVVFVASSPFGDVQTAALDVRTGRVSFDSYYTAGYAEGGTSQTDEDVEVLTYYFPQDDGSRGGLQVWNSNNDYIYASFAELLGYEDPANWDEPYVRLAAVPDHDGYYAFATREGRYAGVIEVCSVDQAYTGG